MAARWVARDRPGAWTASCRNCNWWLEVRTWRRAFGYALKHVCAFR